MTNLCKKYALKYQQVYHSHIDLYQSFNTKNGLNLRSGGDYTAKMSDETKRRMRDKIKGQKRALGYHHTEEAKRKISLTHKGKILTEERKIKMSLSFKGRVSNNKGRK